MATKTIQLLHGILERQAEINADLQAILSDMDNAQAVDIAAVIADNAKIALDIEKILLQQKEDSTVDLSADF